MDFSHYSMEAAHFAADLINTKGTPSGREMLPDVEAWRGFLQPYMVEGAESVTSADIEQIKVVRERLREVFHADEDTAVRLLNEILGDTGAAPYISNHDDNPWHLHYSAHDAPVADRIGSGAAMGLATLIVEKGFSRLGICQADTCGDVYVDTSRNRSRRYCNATCSTRMNVAAYRERQKETTAS
ncbi:MAG: CGNR zinc finger domain-containing protein [Actinomycetota bacterium]